MRKMLAVVLSAFIAMGLFTSTDTVQAGGASPDLQATADKIQAAMQTPQIGNGIVYYVATDGNESNDGLSLSTPLPTVEKAVKKVKAGDTIYVRGGTYFTKQLNPAVSGTENNLITLAAYNNEQVILDGSGVEFSSDKVLRLNNISYWHITGIHVTNSPNAGIQIQNGSHHIRLSNIDSYGNSGTGVSLMQGAHDNVIIDVDSYLNYDAQAGGENADGFGSKFESYDNVFIHTRAWNNSDDGYDFWEGRGDLIAYSEAFRNGVKEDGTTWSSNSDGNGFKLGGTKEGNPSGGNLVVHSIAHHNHSRGFDYNVADLGNTLVNVTAYHNVGVNFRMKDNDDRVINSIAHGPSGTDITTNVVEQINNSWDLNVGDPKFVSTDPASSEFLQLSVASPLIDRGANTTIGYVGKAPDVGAYEYQTALPSVYLAGDSLVMNYSVGSELEGWGQRLGEEFVPAVSVHNHAASNKSSKTFIDEGRLTAILDVIQPGDYLFIQFAHTDGKTGTAGYTDPQTTYKGYLQQYIDGARLKQAIPVLVTSPNRRTYKADGVTISANSDLVAYGQAMKEVGVANNVPVIDLHAKSIEVYHELGVEGTLSLFAPQNNTIHQTAGAVRMAEEIAESIQELDLSLEMFLEP